jgi:O-acetyl-ADP-ribose deacetylase (regulator of RNase III)
MGAMPITYLKGDATSPQAPGPKLIVHICNDSGGWGAGFVLAISARWSRPEEMYRRWYHWRDPERDAGLKSREQGHIVMTSGRFKLGETQLVQVGPGLAVVNMIAQAGTRTGSKGPPIRYDALAACLARVRGYTGQPPAGITFTSVHAPRIGCGLAGGKWEQVEPLIQKALGDVPVYVYDFD